MNARMNTTVAAAAVSLGLAALPASAQVIRGGQPLGYDGGARTPGYHDDGTLNVFGAHLDPRGGRVPGPIGGVAGAVGSVVGGTIGAVGSVVGGAANAADDLTTGSLGYRGNATGYDGRTAY